MNTLRFKGWLACLGVMIVTLLASPAIRAEETAAPDKAEQKEEKSIWKSTGLYGFLSATDIMEKKKAEEDLLVVKELKQDITNPATVTVDEARISLHKFVDTHGVKDTPLNAEETAAATTAIRKLFAEPESPLVAKTLIETIKYGGIGMKDSKELYYFDGIASLKEDTLVYKDDYHGLFPKGLGQLIMILVGCVLIYLAIAKDFEPLLLLPIGFGGILANIPLAGLTDEGGFLYIIYNTGVSNGLFPLIIFMGVGAMTDFGPLIANPKTALLGAAAQFGIFTTLLGAIWLGFSPEQAGSIGIIGGADGPTSIFVTSRLAPELLGAIAVAAYSYMALVPVIQPPIMRWLTTVDERKIEMKQLRHVSKVEKIVFPLLVLGLCILLLPDACPLIGALMFGNLAKESGAVDRLSNCMQNELINIVTIFLGLSVGSKLSAEKFLTGDTLKILILGLAAFCVGTGAGLILARIMNSLSKDKINPLIGSAGVSAVPMAARVANKVGLENNPHNFLLMHAMGPNVAGVIGSAVAAGILLSQLGN